MIAVCYSFVCVRQDGAGLQNANAKDFFPEVILSERFEQTFVQDNTNAWNT